MALAAIASHFGGAFDCTMRDRGEGLCGLRNGKRPACKNAPMISTSRVPEPTGREILHRLPSPGLSSYDLSQHNMSAAGTPSKEEDCSFPGELPRDFFRKLADLMARDREIQNKIAKADMQFFAGHSMRSRFLNACIMSNERDACQLWRSLNGRDKRELLFTYSSGPSSPDFFVTMMTSDAALLSECGSSSSGGDYHDIRSDSTFNSLR